MTYRDPITVVMNYDKSTLHKHQYSVSAIGDSQALGDIYLANSAVGDPPPKTIEVTVRFP